MSERANILVSVKDVLEKFGNDDAFPRNIPTIGSVFAENADMRLVGEDARWSVRFSVPAGQKEEIKVRVREQGYIAEDDYALRAFSAAQKRRAFGLVRPF